MAAMIHGVSNDPCGDGLAADGRETPMKAEPLLAKLNELRHEAEDDKTDREYLALHHAFCFISYKMAEFQAYLNEVERTGGGK